jgi:hypothetical protein
VFSPLCHVTVFCTRSQTALHSSPMEAPSTFSLKLQGRFFAETSPLTAGFLRYRRSSDYLYGISHRFHRDRPKVVEVEEVVRVVGSLGEKRAHSGRGRNSSSSRHNYLDRSRTVSFRDDKEKGQPELPFFFVGARGFSAEGGSAVPILRIGTSWRRTPDPLNPIQVRYRAALRNRPE